VAEALSLHLTGGLTVHPPGAVRKTDDTPYMVFTPFSRAWKALPLPSGRDVLVAPTRLPAVSDVPSLAIPDVPILPDGVPFPPGEAEAQRRLAAFADVDDPPIYRYAQGRNQLDRAGTSQLSPYLRFGMLSARQAVVSALAAARRADCASAQQGAKTWLNELIWREFFVNILHHFPEVREQSFRADLRDIAWENDSGAFAAWCEGRTGYPVVDAAVRQLVETGWMHNRARMIVASFLVKDLLVDWRWGERFFMQHLVDGDPAANNGGWQWTAGTGTDAAPYFRIFNPILQGKKHDPDGVFVRRWLPELARVPAKHLHAPWKMPDEVQREVVCVIGQHYPAPIIDHAWARERTLAAYAQAREAGHG
jgi:deoxyribodipyrimidine photo-lyase